MSEMIVRMARAIRDVPVGSNADNLWEPLELRQARAVLAVLREPTEDMVKAKFQCFAIADPLSDGMTGLKNRRNLWHAMIDVAAGND